MFKSTVLVLVAAAAFTPAALAAQSFDGTVSDSMCGLKHMMPGKSDAQCIRECVKAGSKYVLVVGSKTYTLGGPSDQIAAFAGQRVHVEGTLHATTLTVQAIHAAR